MEWRMNSAKGRLVGRRTTNGTRLRKRPLKGVECLEQRLTMACDVGDPLVFGSSSSDASDVNADGIVTPIDAALIANALNARGSSPARSEPGYGSLDVSGNGALGQEDFESVLDHLAGRRPPGDKSGPTMMLDEDTPVVSVMNIWGGTKEVRPADVIVEDWPGRLHFLRNDLGVGALTVNIAITGTATSGVDYAALPTSITFPDGEIEYVLYVTPSRDDIVEGDEHVQVTIQPGAGYTFNVGSHTESVGIDDNDYWAWDPDTITRPAVSEFDRQKDDVYWGVLYGYGSLQAHGAWSDDLESRDQAEVTVQSAMTSLWKEPNLLGGTTDYPLDDSALISFDFDPKTGVISRKQYSDSSRDKQNGNLEIALETAWKFENAGNDVHYVDVEFDAQWAAAYDVTGGAKAGWLGFEANVGGGGSVGWKDDVQGTFRIPLRRFTRH